MKLFTVRKSTMKTATKFFGTLLFATSLGFASVTASADESFKQGGHEYILRSNIVGVIRKPVAPAAMTEQEREAAKKNKTFFDIYDTSFNPKKVRGSIPQKNRFRVVYKQVKNPKTHEVKEVPGLLTGDVIVQAKNKEDFVLNTNLKLKKSYKEAGFYIYELPENKSVSDVLNELSKESNVEQARVEIIEHLRIPL